ncbi:PREDICTED: peptidyl-prolyl cis-trans isomerase FKBP16-3, chloroplastic [Tarenaya hassleriana]|uniref:peptidyl-prolyl cis-trans isomerase FKBP16-3, chloroplastic n=1 Tax=Tarenaya hassleriana TaxID=28532 RepID=UPI00053C9C14|nr:PREDICTED: peptidyl-prolyl cis-trans isomerase FKBP16-3, chloroplastic [Tarenaya hassleriana]
MAACSTSLLLPSGSVTGKGFKVKHQSEARGTATRLRIRASGTREKIRETNLPSRREVIQLVIGASALSISSLVANAAGLPPEEKPRLCDDTCEKELENVPMVTTESGLQYKDIKVGAGPSPPVGFQVAANYVAMVPSGQIFDSSLEKGRPYLFRVGSGQVIKGLDEGILSMKIGGKRRLYIPGPLAFPKGLTSAPGRPRVPPSSPVVFDVSLEYIPGLEADEE